MGAVVEQWVGRCGRLYKPVSTTAGRAQISKRTLASGTRLNSQPEVWAKTLHRPVVEGTEA